MISDREWAAILAEIQSRIPGSQFVLDTVVKVDEKNRLIFVKGFPGTPVPLIGFEGIVKTYDRTLADPDPWHEIGAPGEPAYEHSWVAFDARPVAFRKDQLGMVHLTGVIKDGTIGLSAFTLPVGYRIADNMGFSVSTSGGVVGTINALDNGNITPAVGSNAFFFLNQVTYLADGPIDSSKVDVKKEPLTVCVPEIDDTVLLVRGLGPSGTVRCVGGILSTGYMVGL